MTTPKSQAAPATSADIARYRRARALAERAGLDPEHARSVAATAALRLRARDELGRLETGLCFECVHLRPCGRGWQCKAPDPIARKPTLWHVLLLPHACAQRRIATPGDPGAAPVLRARAPAKSP